MLVAAQASASPVTWYLQDVTYRQGGTTTGSFVYDSNLNTYSSIDITTTASGSYAGSTYHALDPAFGPTSTAAFFVPNSSLPDFTGTPVLLLLFNQALTSAGGTIGINIDISTDTLCYNATCSDVSLAHLGSRFFLTGSITTAPVPEPSAIGLLLFGGLGLLWFSRRPTAGR